MKPILHLLGVCIVAFSGLLHAVHGQTTTSAGCVGGAANIFPCKDVDLLAHIDLDTLFAPDSSSGHQLNDVWGWTDPMTGKEYALVGRSDALQFVDVSDPLHPEILGILPSHEGQVSIWRDVKVYENHAFVVMDAAINSGLQIFDLTQLRSSAGPHQKFEPTALYPHFDGAHNIVINEETGFAYVIGHSAPQYHCNAGYHMIDIHNPSEPKYAGCKQFHSDSAYMTYVHDAQCLVYRGPDLDYHGREICLGFNQEYMTIVDVTDKRAPVFISGSSYPNVGYTHQGWITPDHKYVFMNDEWDEVYHFFYNGARTIIWDIEDLEDPVVQQEFYGTQQGIDHNLYVHGDYVYQANYATGLRILDIENINDPQEVAFFVTAPSVPPISYLGAWSVYPFFESGTLLVSSQHEGLFLLRATGLRGSDPKPTGAHIELQEIPVAMQLLPAHPNPANPVTALTLQLPAPEHIRVAAYDMAGREIHVLHDGIMDAGNTTLRFDGSGLPAGRYAIRAMGQSTSSTQLITLMQ